MIRGRSRSPPSITTADVRSYTCGRQEAGAKNATINRELALLKRAFRLAEQGGKLLHHPYIPLLEEDNVRTGFFERSDFVDIRRRLPVEVRALATFLYCTGWRIGEVLPLEWSQVDREAKTVRLEPGTTKNKDGRTFPYGALPELKDAIEDQWAEHERLWVQDVLSPSVFVRFNGEPIRDVRKAWRSAREAAGLPGALMHDFRRTAVRNLVRAGVPDTVAMKLTGHKTRSVFDRYDVTSEADLREAVEKLSNAVATEKGQSKALGRVRRIAASKVSDDVSKVYVGGPSGTRTPDQRIKSPMLYQLS